MPDESPPFRPASARDRLLDATTELVARGGYHGTGMNAVLAASGVGNGSLYHHFPGGKDQLVAASMQRTGERTAEAIAALVAEGPEHAVDAMFEAGIARLRVDDFDAGCRIATPLADAAVDAEEVRVAAGEAFAKWTGAIAAGLVDAGWEPDVARSTAVVAVSLYEGALLLARAERTTRPFEDARQAALDLVAARAPRRRRG